jgi:hypothetical protein
MEPEVWSAAKADEVETTVVKPVPLGAPIPPHVITP